MWSTPIQGKNEVAHRRHNYFWLVILGIASSIPKDANNARDTIAPKEFQLILHLIVKLWPFRGWAMDLIGKIHSAL